MQVNKIMTRNPVCVTSDMNLKRIAYLMGKNNFSCVPIIEKDSCRKPIGIVTDRDIVIRGVTSFDDSAKVKAEEIMTTDLVTVHQDADIETCYKILTKKKIHHLLVVDNDGILQGIITKDDLNHRKVAFETAKILRISENFFTVRRRREGVNSLI